MTQPKPAKPAYPAVAARRRAFSLVELLVVVAIIVILISILVPVAGRVRTASQAADTASMIRAIDAAIQVYQTDHQAWPGPLGEGQVGQGVDSTVQIRQVTGDPYLRPNEKLKNVTGTENMVLGLLGGIVPVTTGTTTTTTTFQYDPAAVGRGPVKLGGRSPGGYPAYFSAQDSSLSMHPVGDGDVSYAGASNADLDKQSGRFVGEVVAADDSIVPEFVDRFSGAMPILYLRANPVARVSDGSIDTAKGKNIAGETTGVFHLNQISGYVEPPTADGPSVGSGFNPSQRYSVDGKTDGGKAKAVNAGTAAYYHGLQFLTKDANTTSAAALRQTMQKGSDSYTYPYDVRAYLTSPTSVAARQADRYVLISAGRDRIYGTEDDLTNFGSVAP